MPSSSTVSPGFKPAEVSAFHAVTPAHGSVAACSWLKCFGTRTSASSDATIRSVSTPSRPPPSEDEAPVSVNVPARCFARKLGITRSPTDHLVTADPPASTSPDASDSGVTGFMPLRGYPPLVTIRSRKLSEQAWTSTST